MDTYNISEYGSAEAYLTQGTEAISHLTSPFLDQVEAMYNEGAPEFVVDQGLYYPAATNYGYYCTGFESPGEWEDHCRIFGVDGPDVQFAGLQNENLPYVYYTPSYGYAQSPYNPYNPYIPGAMIGVDGPFVGAQQYYSVPPYQNPVSSPAFVPVVIQPDIGPNTSPEPLIDSSALIANGPDGRGLKHNHLASGSAAFPRNLPKLASNQTNSYNRASESQRSNVGPSKQPLLHGSVSPGNIPAPNSSRIFQGRATSGSGQSADSIPNGKVLSQRNHLKVGLPLNNGFTEFGTSAHGRAGGDKLRSKIYTGRGLNDVSGNPDTLGEQNRGPRTNRSKNQLAVKAYTTKAGECNDQGNIIIYTDQYNKEDFSVDYADAKFFVIKSYSEDDVHKSIKYNVWSSTPHGNKKLESAYDDSLRITAAKSRSCPIFLFFSVNASGQFCGVAEMIGPVDFYKDMDFWQQDKWGGSFPVKWHIIKDVPNAHFRHIILENNENKPVTNSRDTQEILYKQGIEMLKIFKNHPLKTSLLDDFMYYETRQKIIQEEKARLLTRSFKGPFLMSTLDPTKLNCVVNVPSNGDGKVMPHNDRSSVKEAVGQDLSKLDATNTNIANGSADISVIEARDDIASTIRIGSLTINPKQSESESFAGTANSAANTEVVDVVTVGSMPVKVSNGFAKSSGILTVGTIPLDPRALQLDKGVGFANKGSRFK